MVAGPVPGPDRARHCAAGEAASFKDIDNRARDVITEFNTAFATIEPAITGYRVYRQPDAPDNDVRVRLLPEPRLRRLAAALDDARAFIAENRGERSRPLDPPHRPRDAAARR